MKKTRRFTTTEKLRTAYIGYIRKPAQLRLYDYLQAIAAAQHTWSGPSFGNAPFTSERRRKAHPEDSASLLIH